MPKLFFLASLAVLISCKDGDDPVVTYSQPSGISAASSSLNFSPEKQYRKAGVVMLFENSNEELNNGVKIWSSPYPPKDVIHHLKYGQDVYVYAKTSDYLLVAPKSDTTKLGYILSGWITFDGNERNNFAPVGKTEVYQDNVIDKPKKNKSVTQTGADKLEKTTAAKIVTPAEVLEIKTDSIAAQ